ncbi:MAG: methionine--tRNA ligase [Firmicutes bacterium]|nr:methionine--tRNA ligase [Bacillota bacterium]
MSKIDKKSAAADGKANASNAKDSTLSGKEKASDKTASVKATAGKAKFFISTPIYYPSGRWHLGHSYTTVCCDALAQFKRMDGFDVFYLTGTDEHGQKIAEAAKKHGKTPLEYTTELADDIKRLWSALGIRNDKFIRTTDDYHKRSVQKIFKTLFDKGDIYKSTYKGKYCTPCESFWQDGQLVDGDKCPDCKRETVFAEEECYFFALSKYADKITNLLLKTDFLQPKHRAMEMYNNFIKDGLQDLAVSRTSVEWGIEVDFDKKHTVYVWIDALSNYINALGYNGDNANMDFWTDDKNTTKVHIVGKEIVRFHTIIWPAILMALSLPLPDKVFGHGWLVFGGDKMSKSKGNVACPFNLIDKYGSDAVRYYLLREMPFGSDANYTDLSFLNRINADLCNDYGNLIKRTLAMGYKYFAGLVKKIDTAAEDKAFVDLIDGARARATDCINSLSPSMALEEIFKVISFGNKYVDEVAPWNLEKEGKQERLNQVMYVLFEAIRVASTLLLPFVPVGANEAFKSLNLPVPTDFEGAVFGAVDCYSATAGEIIYKRLDVKKELELLQGV